MSQQTETRLTSSWSVFGVLGIIVAALGLSWSGPMWFLLVGFVLAALYVVGPAVLAVVFGQVALVAAGSPPLLLIGLVEGGLLLALLVEALAAPNRWESIALMVVFVPALGGVVWLLLERATIDPLLVGTGLLGGAAVVGYLVHRYLLIKLDIVTQDTAGASDLS